MDLKIMARLGAFVLVAVALVAAALELRSSDTPDVAVSDTGRLAGDPLTVDLVRCGDLGAAAANDAGCQRIWAENRRRFLGPSAPSTTGAAPTAPPAGDAPIAQKNQSRIEAAQPSPGREPSDGDPQRRDVE